MSAQTHSQGEWQVRETATHYQIHTAEHEVALVRKVTDGAPGWSSEKDALLIAAAPKLLAGCRGLLEANTTATRELAVRAIVRATAEATGEAP